MNKKVSETGDSGIIEITFISVFKILWKRRWLVLIITLLLIGVFSLYFFYTAKLGMGKISYELTIPGYEQEDYTELQTAYNKFGDQLLALQEEKQPLTETSLKDISLSIGKKIIDSNTQYYYFIITVSDKFKDDIKNEDRVAKFTSELLLPLIEIYSPYLELKRQINFGSTNIFDNTEYLVYRDRIEYLSSKLAWIEMTKNTIKTTNSNNIFINPINTKNDPRDTNPQFFDAWVNLLPYDNQIMTLNSELYDIYYQIIQSVFYSRLIVSGIEKEFMPGKGNLTKLLTSSTQYSLIKDTISKELDTIVAETERILDESNYRIDTQLVRQTLNQFKRDILSSINERFASKLDSGNMESITRAEPTPPMKARTILLKLIIIFIVSLGVAVIIAFIVDYFKNHGDELRNQ